MEEEEIIHLSEEELGKFERFNKALENRKIAEAKLESQKKYRILFERASADTLPFIVYAIYTGSLALIVLFQLLSYSGDKLYIGAFLLFVIIIAPFFISSNKGWKRIFSRKKEFNPPPNEE